MPDTPRQQQNAERIRRALAGKRFYVRPVGKSAWNEIGAVEVAGVRRALRAIQSPFWNLTWGAAVMMVDAKARRGRKGSK